MEIEMKIKQQIEESGLSFEELEQITGIKKEDLKVIQELPADEVLLHELVLIADALNVRIENLFEVKKLKII
ncbi:MAG: helix-turn-helix domain-containing protein [Clostridia bacterium]|nr:helix-turn-helix domain-containing protein [Clostridia bacterium]